MRSRRARRGPHRGGAVVGGARRGSRSQVGEAATTARRSALHPITGQTADLPSHRNDHTVATPTHCRVTDSALRPPPQPVLAITLDREPPFLCSTGNRLRTAVQGCVLRPVCAGVGRHQPWSKETTRRPLSQVRNGMVGLAGLEPAASSLSEIDGCALCYPAFPQLALIHERHRMG
jgi:hypothetical protein